MKFLRSPTTKIWKGTKNAEIGVVWGLGVTQGHWQHSHSIEHILHPVLYCIWVIITYFPQFEDVKPRPLKGQFIIPMLKDHMANQFTKFEISSFNRSRDFLGETMKLKRSQP